MRRLGYALRLAVLLPVAVLAIIALAVVFALAPRQRDEGPRTPFSGRDDCGYFD